MQVKEVMSTKPQFLDANSTIQEATVQMKEKDCGCMPVGQDNKLVGLLTDRDIAIQVVADGKSAEEKVGDIARKDVLYCFETDDIKDVLNNMKDQKVQRLAVLNNKENKDFVGMVTVADIADKCAEDNELSKAISACCKHYH